MTTMIVYLQTGQTGCHDDKGDPIPCRGSGQDAEFRRGMPWPTPRFAVVGDLVEDRLRGLVWSRDANPAEFPLTWQEALDFVADLRTKAWLDHSDWRLPNVNALESLVDCSRCEPALPPGHPPGRVRQGYWSSTTSMFEPDWAWALYTQSGGVGVGQKTGRHFHVWAVRDKVA